MDLLNRREMRSRFASSYARALSLEVFTAIVTANEQLPSRLIDSFPGSVKESSVCFRCQSVNSLSGFRMFFFSSLISCPLYTGVTLTQVSQRSYHNRCRWNGFAGYILDLCAQLNPARCCFSDLGSRQSLRYEQDARCCSMCSTKVKILQAASHRSWWTRNGVAVPRCIHISCLLCIVNGSIVTYQLTWIS